MDSHRKASKPSSLRIEHAKNGGFMVHHSFDNSNAGPSYRMPETHVFKNHADMMSHVHKATASKPSDNDGDEVSSTKEAPTKKQAPGARSYGAGVD